MRLVTSIGEQECWCPRCKNNYRRCVDMDQYAECVKWCEVCDGTARDPIPWSELFAYRREPSE